jgi:hypothetical protein
MDRIGRTHRQVTSRTDGLQIRDLCGAPTTFWNIMTDMEVKHSHYIRTPGDQTLGLKTATGVRDPDLFS